MDIASIVGFAAAWVLLLASLLINPQAKLLGFVDYPSIVMVCGGSVVAILCCYPLADVLKFPKIYLKSFFNTAKNPLTVIEQLVSLGEVARRDGLLALENRMEEIDDKFLANGIRMAVDGMSVEIVESIMRTEMDAVGNRHGLGKGMLGMFGKYAPAYGMIGTLCGLVIMLGDMKPETIGSGMAVALLTTLYGAVIANVVFLPFADKLSYISEQELQMMEITVRGVIAIQSGENPRVIKQKLMTFVPANQRPSEEEA